MKERGQQVFPVFYLGVDPSDVRHQTGFFELKRKSQVEVEVREHELVYGEDEDRLNAWRAALTDVANPSGWDSKNYPYLTKLIDEIVNHILKKSVYTSSSVDKGFIGMDSVLMIITYVHSFVQCVL